MIAINMNTKRPAIIGHIFFGRSFSALFGGAFIASVGTVLTATPIMITENPMIANTEVIMSTANVVKLTSRTGRYNATIIIAIQ